MSSIAMRQGQGIAEHDRCDERWPLCLGLFSLFLFKVIVPRWVGRVKIFGRQNPVAFLQAQTDEHCNGHLKAGDSTRCFAGNMLNSWEGNPVNYKLTQQAEPALTWAPGCLCSKALLLQLPFQIKPHNLSGPQLSYLQWVGDVCGFRDSSGCHGVYWSLSVLLLWTTANMNTVNIP